MSALKDKLRSKISSAQEDVRSVMRDHGDHVISEVTVAQTYGGMRGVKSLVTETSALDPMEGIRFRGYSIPEIHEALPTAPGGKEPLPEGLFWLLLTGELPTADEVASVTAEWRSHEELPEHVKATLNAMPEDAHPMSQLSVGIVALQHDSIFARRYREGMNKTEYWEATLDDSMVLLGRMPSLAAFIYRRSYRNGDHIAPTAGADWAGNLAAMMGVGGAEFSELMRLYLTILADHEGGNVSAHATHLVGSALSDPYLSLSAGINGLAGPLHGLASQEVMRWIFGVKEKLGGGVPTEEQLTTFLWETLNAGRVVPGYGHGVLRTTDPRYMAQQRFADAHLPDDENYKIVRMLYEIVPGILQEHGKAKNPWPNVDAHTGCLFVHFGLVEYDFYTVLFGVSRTIGVLSSLVWDRILGLPLERPNSVTTESSLSGSRESARA
jgi:citrate synthase